MLKYSGPTNHLEFNPAFALQQTMDAMQRFAEKMRRPVVDARLHRRPSGAPRRQSREVATVGMSVTEPRRAATYRCGSVRTVPRRRACAARAPRRPDDSGRRPARPPAQAVARRHPRQARTARRPVHRGRSPRRRPHRRRPDDHLPRPSRQRAARRPRQGDHRAPGGRRGRRDGIRQDHAAAQDLPRTRPRHPRHHRPHAASPARRAHRRPTHRRRTGIPRSARPSATPSGSPTRPATAPSSN